MVLHVKYLASQTLFIHSRFGGILEEEKEEKKMAAFSQRFGGRLGAPSPWCIQSRRGMATLKECKMFVSCGVTNGMVMVAAIKCLCIVGLV